MTEFSTEFKYKMNSYQAVVVKGWNLLGEKEVEVGLKPGGGTGIDTGNVGGTKLTAGTAGATGILGGRK